MSALIRHSAILTTVSTLALGVAAPALAQQMTPKDAWGGLRMAAAGAGLTIRSQSTTDLGSALQINGLQIVPSADPGALVISMDSLRIEPRGDMIAVIPSERIGVLAQFGGGITREFEILHDGEIMGSLSEEEAALDFDFGMLTARLIGANQRGRAMDDALSVTFNGLGARMRAQREGSADVSVGAASASYEFSFADVGGISQRGSGSLEGARLEFAATELDQLEYGRTIRDWVDAGVTARLTFSVGPSSGLSVQTMDGTEITMGSTAVDSGLTASFVDGLFEASIYAGEGTLTGGMGPIQGSGSFGGMTFDVAAPLVVTPDDQTLRYAFNFADVLPPAELVTMLGAGPFAGDSLSIALDLGAQGRLVREIPIGGDFDDDEPPFDISEIRLDQALIRVGDSEFTGAGAVTLIGGLLANLGRDMPEAQGDMTFNLVGGERLLGRVQAMNMVPQDQLFFVRMMVNGLGRSVGEDHLQADLAIRPGGVITINGAPLPF